MNATEVAMMFAKKTVADVTQSSSQTENSSKCKDKQTGATKFVENKETNKQPPTQNPKDLKRAYKFSYFILNLRKIKV